MGRDWCGGFSGSLVYGRDSESVICDKTFAFCQEATRLWEMCETSIRRQQQDERVIWFDTMETVCGICGNKHLKEVQKASKKGNNDLKETHDQMTAVLEKKETRTRRCRMRRRPVPRCEERRAEGACRARQGGLPASSN